MVLAHSLRDNGTRKQLAILVTLDTLQASTIEELKVSCGSCWRETRLLRENDRRFTTISYPWTVL